MARFAALVVFLFSQLALAEARSVAMKGWGLEDQSCRVKITREGRRYQLETTVPLTLHDGDKIIPVERRWQFGV